MSFMNKKKIDYNQTTPDWLDEGLANTPTPTPAELAKYDYMKEDFLEAVKAPQKAPSSVDLVFSMAGKLLRWAGEVAADLTITPEPLMAGTRSAAPPATQPSPSWKILGRACKPVGDYWLEAATILENNKSKLLVNLIDAEGRNIRPLTLVCRDLAGNVIAGPLTIASGENFLGPDPEAGVYVFEVSWEGGRRHGELRLEYLG
jgi:hypothetical protein